MFFSRPIIEIIFQRGAFDVNSTIQTAKPFLVYSIGLVFFAIETILVIFYYSLADTKTPVFVGMICVVINILLTWLLVNIIGYIGIALAYILQKILKNIILLLLLKHKIRFDMLKVWRFLLRLIVPILGILIVFVFMSNLFVHISAEKVFIKLIILTGIFCVCTTGYLVVLCKIGVLKSLIKKG
jgi:peptidoglycan biosynthesis protein MviN/MurJ (putative lipid II flippase)